MHIPLPKFGFLDKEKTALDLEKLIEQPSARQLRPCPGCRLPCESVSPTDCATDCGATCINAPQALSSEPEAHPIELKVVPIVFELSALRLLQPCWSCEGHVNGQGELWKLPQVSFYTASDIYPKLLAVYLTRLKNQRTLHYPWQVIVVDYGQTWGPTYQLEPALNHISEEIRLDLLQKDLETIADDLAEKIKQEARFMLVNIRQG